MNQSCDSGDGTVGLLYGRAPKLSQRRKQPPSSTVTEELRDGRGCILNETHGSTSCCGIWWSTRVSCLFVPPRTRFLHFSKSGRMKPDRCSGAKFSVGTSASLIILHHPCQPLPPHKSNWPPNCLPFQKHYQPFVSSPWCFFIPHISGKQGQSVRLVAFAAAPNLRHSLPVLFFFPSRSLAKNELKIDLNECSCIFSLLSSSAWMPTKPL